MTGLYEKILRRVSGYPTGGDWSGRILPLRILARILPAGDRDALEHGVDCMLPALEGLRDSGDDRQVRACLEIWRELDERVWEAQRRNSPLTALYVRYRMADACDAAGERKEAAELFRQVAQQLTEYVREDNPNVLAIRRRAQACAEDQ